MRLRRVQCAIRRLVAPLLAARFCAVLFCALIASPSSAIAGTIPVSHSSILLAKCLPYNDSWKGRATIDILVLAIGENTESTPAEEFASHLIEVGVKLRDRDPTRPVFRVTTSTLRQFDLTSLNSDLPQIVYLAEGEGRACRSLRTELVSLSDAAKRLGILIFTDSRSAYRDAASIYFAIGDHSRPEIYGNLTRARDQGGQLQGAFQRLLKQEVAP